jgi:hypothetical protein
LEKVIRNISLAPRNVNPARCIAWKKERMLALTPSRVDVSSPCNLDGGGVVVADLLDDLLAKPQRETAGADTSSRFDYQKGWAFCQMLRRHMDGADYLAAFEFHDEVVFLEPNHSPGNEKLGVVYRAAAVRVLSEKHA